MSEQTVNVDRIGGALVALGQTTNAGSIPVTIASDCISSVVLSGGASITSLPVGHNIIDSGGGQQLSATSVPVVIASDQTALRVDNSLVTALLARQRELQQMQLQLQAMQSGSFVPQPESLPFLSY